MILHAVAKNDELLFEAISANTTAELSLSPNDEDNATTTIPEGIGNPTEVALLLWCYKNGKNYNSYRSETKILHQLPFSTERKYMATISLYNGVPYLFIRVLQKWCCRSVTSQKTRKQKPKAPSVAIKIRLCAPLLWLISNSIAMWLKA